MFARGRHWKMRRKRRRQRPWPTSSLPTVLVGYELRTLYLGWGFFFGIIFGFFLVFFLVLGLRRKEGGQEERKEGRDRFFVHICAGNAGSNATLC